MSSFTPHDSPAALGHHFLVGISGPTLDRSDKELLKKLRPAGIMLLKRNFLAAPAEQTPQPYGAWLTALRSLLSEAQNYSEREQFVVSIDHEGGRVVRTPPPLSVFPYACHYARRVREVARVMAAELRATGINLVFGPVADIHSNPMNPVIGERAFGTTSDVVTEAALAFTEEMQSAGLLTCAKHFPGHGDTAKDSHHELPILDRSLSELRDRELRPFAALAKAGIPAVMTAHILFPKVDPHFPATMSRPVLQGVLREEFGFPGVIISDDLDMRAISARVHEPEGIAALINASCDLLIVSRHLEPFSLHPLTIAKALGVALTRRLVREDALAQSWERIQTLLREKLPPSTITELSAQTLYANNQLAQEISREAQAFSGATKK